MTLFEELNRRGLVAQMTHPEEIEKLLNGGSGKFYMGFDATANSLHVGHFLVLTTIRRLQNAGLTPILLLGTGTTMVGDPSGRTDMRQMLTVEEINHNADLFVEQMGRVVDLDKAIVARNGDWLMNLNYIELLRDVGVHFSVNKMLSYECFKSRMEQGLSFLEFNYMIMQSYDFLQLFQRYGCVMQLGGNDQWSNIISGVDLIRRIEGKEAYGLTFTLLATKDGVKMGKTMGGAIWLDAERTSPYDFYQYWRNIGDDDVINCLKMLTFLPIEEIEAMEAWQGSELNRAKEILAYEVTKDVHGVDEAEKAQGAAKSVFGAGAVSDDMPTTMVEQTAFTDGRAPVIDLLVLAGIAPSKAEARRLIQQGGIAVDDEKVGDIAAGVDKSSFDKGHVIVKRGKKIYHKLILG